MQQIGESYIINEADKEGYIVMFTWNENDKVDHFPRIEEGEKPISTMEEACDKANEFARKTDGRTRNIQVIKQTLL